MRFVMLNNNGQRYTDYIVVMLYVCIHQFNFNISYIWEQIELNIALLYNIMHPIAYQIYGTLFYNRITYFRSQ